MNHPLVVALVVSIVLHLPVFISANFSALFKNISEQNDTPVTVTLMPWLDASDDHPFQEPDVLAQVTHRSDKTTGTRDASSRTPNRLAGQPQLITNRGSGSGQQNVPRNAANTHTSFSHPQLPSDTNNPDNVPPDANTQAVPYAHYIDRIRQKVGQVWRYPPRAREAQMVGALTIAFTIGQDGRLLDVSVAESSGWFLLDDSAIRAVQKAAPFEPLDRAWKLRRLHIKTAFEYGQW
ncbi:MAG: TonB family protein [Magnetococcales bacterium]|nr:TonB family protein [Magnetococcales bacterium]